MLRVDQNIVTIDLLFFVNFKQENGLRFCEELSSEP